MIRVLCLITPLMVASLVEAGPAPADLVFVHGAVYTMDAARSRASAVAVRGTRIVYVGDDATARRFVGHHTRLIDLGGRMLLPGFQDSHVHPGDVIDPVLGLDLHGLIDRDAIFARITSYAAAHRDAHWIVGDGWDAAAFQPGGLPTRGMLDGIIADRPALLYDNAGHSAWVNSAALAAAHIDAHTPDPPSGRIERDSAGNPTGVLHEDAAMNLVQSLVPPLSAAEQRANLTAALTRLAAAGVTALEDAMATPAIVAAYRELDQAHALAQRVNLCMPFDPGEPDDPQVARFIATRAHVASDRLSAGCVKLFLDGAAAAHALALLAPYSDRPELGRGELFIDPARLTRLVVRLDALGFRVHMHAQGDGAIRAGLDAIAAARTAHGDTDRRHSIAHLWLIDPDDVPRFRELGVVANMTPLWSLADTWETVDAPAMFGPKRMREVFPMRSLIASGAVLVWGSDWPVTSMSPLEGLETALTHRYPGGLTPFGQEDQPLRPEERVDLPQAIAAYTSAGAYFLRDEHRRGSIIAGLDADLVVLDHDLFTVAPGQIHTVPVDLTVIQGRIVHARGTPPR